MSEAPPLAEPRVASRRASGGRHKSADEFTGQVRRAVSSSMARGAPSASNVARLLGIAYVTMQQKLQRRDITYRAILNEARVTRSVGLLLTGDERISDISAALGFRSPEVFSAWFKQQFGRSPTHFREACWEQKPLTDIQGPDQSD